MKNRFFLIIFLALAFASKVSAGPFIVCDPQPGIQYYQVTGSVWAVGKVVAQTDGSIHMDAAKAPDGLSELLFQACIYNDLWGERCSDPAPFSFTPTQKPVFQGLYRLAP